MSKPFTKDFYWGASTSAHQVEGNNYNSWTVWEESKENIENSGIACDHYNRFEEDFDLAKKLNHNAHRFSIEWSRIEPEEGIFNKNELEHYKNVILALRTRVNWMFGRNKNEKVSDLGWEFYPQGIYNVLKDLYEKYKKTLYVTESGLADAKDIHRVWYIEETVKAMHLVLDEGVDLKGYMHWSLIDNFEWAHGFWPRFGLIEIDRNNNLQRKVRKSALRYSEIINNNGEL